MVGFAAEHGPEAVTRARDKLARKGLDAIVVNDISRPDIGFDSDQNEVVIIGARGRAPRSAQLQGGGRDPRARLRAGAALPRGIEPAASARADDRRFAHPRAGRVRPVPARPRADRRESLGAGDRAPREGEATRAGQELDPRDAWARVLSQRPLSAAPQRSSGPSSIATRPTTTRTSAWAARSRSSATGGLPAAYVARAGMRPDRSDYRLYRDRLKAA